MSRGRDYPIILGKELKKGVFCIRNGKGYDLYIVWLKKEYNHGEKYNMADIDKVDAVIHFCDKESVELTISTLNWILKNGIGE